MTFTRSLLLTSLLVVLSWWCVRCEASSPVLSVTGGKVIGVVEESARGRPYYAYRGVPYAASPEGENRFKPPQELGQWDGVLDAIEVKAYCAQAARGVLQGQEDCLHLSVYTPQLPSDQKRGSLPVLVWLHGGAFVVSGAGDYDPLLMMDKNLVLVVPQYRLGFLGFAYVEKEAPGNYGMLDQVAALRWVQENIAQFGGDPSRVTLGGDCAGGASALYHMISPLSQGLFHGVVSVSGSPINPWAKHWIQRQSRMIFALRLSCPRHSSEAMAKCFLETPLEKLLERQPFVLDAPYKAPDLLFVGNNNIAPVVQPTSGVDELAQFLTEEPVILFGQGQFAKVPVLMITAADEGNFVINEIIDEWAVKELQKEKNEKFNEEMLNIVIEKAGMNIKKAPDMTRLMAQYFTGHQDKPYQEKLAALAEFMADTLYNAGTIQLARYLNDQVPTRILRFDFEDGPHIQHFNRTDPPATPAVAPGAGHGDQLTYFLPKQHQPFTTDQQERVSDTMIGILDDFVYGKEPAEDWPTTTDEGLECTVINKDGSTGQGRLLSSERVATSEIIVEQHYRNPLHILKKLIPRDEL